MAITHPPTRTAGAGDMPARPQMTYEEFLAWSDEDTYAEWVDGEVFVHMPPTPFHQHVAGFLAGLLRAFAEIFDLGRVFSGPIQMKLPDGPGREPDILFVSKEHAARVVENRLDGPADLVVEIVSDDSVTRDREDKFYEYESAGILEYWIVDPRPNRRRAFFYRLDDRGRYQPVAVGADGIYRSHVVPGFWLNVNWLQGDDVPETWQALAEIVGRERLIEYLRAGRLQGSA